MITDTDQRDFKGDQEIDPQKLLNDLFTQRIEAKGEKLIILESSLMELRIVKNKEHGFLESMPDNKLETLIDTILSLKGTNTYNAFLRRNIRQSSPSTESKKLHPDIRERTDSGVVLTDKEETNTLIDPTVTKVKTGKSSWTAIV